MYDKADETELKCEIAAMRQGFLTTCSLRTANENWQYFTTRLQQIVNTLVPKKIVRGRHLRHDLPWLDPLLRRKIGKKNRFNRRAKKAKPHNRHQRWEAYRNLQHSVKEEIKVAYNHYINSLFEDEETGKPSKNFWKTIKAKRRDQVGIPPLQGKNGKLESTSKGKAQILNAQYASVFQDEGKSKPPDLGNSPYPSMPKIDVSVEGVKKLLLRLNPKKAVGPDMVPIRILRDYADDIAPILQSIFQQSLDTGMVPEDWKKANVTTVFKKGSRQVASNYRPVSLTCVSCKLQSARAHCV